MLQNYDMLKEKIKQLPPGTVFKIGFKELTVENITATFEKIIIKTNKQTFVKDAKQFDDFFGEIIILDKNKPLKNKIKVMVPDVKKQVFDAEVIRTNGNSKKISEALMAIFDEITHFPTPESLKKAEVMVKLSNAIVINEMANFKVITHRF